MRVGPQLNPRSFVALFAGFTISRSYDQRIENNSLVGCAGSSVTDFSQPQLSEQSEKMQA